MLIKTHSVFHHLSVLVTSTRMYSQIDFMMNFRPMIDHEIAAKHQGFHMISTRHAEPTLRVFEKYSKTVGFAVHYCKHVATSVHMQHPHRNICLQNQCIFDIFMLGDTFAS